MQISSRLKNPASLFKAARAILEKAILARGTTIYNYVNPDGEEGSYAMELKVYGRTGESCFRCNKKISRLVIAGRSSHFCVVCQKKS
jgi:formamidopyrimidine-DNA glycosylase